MLTNIISVAINAVLDPVFIFVFGWGIKGAAWATALSQVVSFCVLLSACFKGNNIRIKIKNFTFKHGLHKKIFMS